MKAKFLLPLFLGFSIPQLLAGQSYNLVKSIPIPTPVAVTHDPIGQIYIQTVGGDMIKYDMEGEEVNRFNSSNTEKITSIDAGQSLRLFAFYRESQRFQYFDRYLTPSPMYNLPEQDQGFYQQAVPSTDNGIWLWDASHLNLKKYKPALHHFIVDTPVRYYLDEDYQISQIQEYQNRVYVNEQHHAIMVFDPLGNYIQKLPVTHIDHFDFYHDELYWIEEKTIHLYSLYTMQKRQMELPDNKDPLFVLLIEDRLFIFHKQEMIIYRIVRP